MIFIYKELIKKHIYLLTTDHIKTFAISNGECLSDREANIIYNYIMNNYHDLLNKKNNSLIKLKPHLRKDLFEKLERLYNEYSTKYL